MINSANEMYNQYDQLQIHNFSEATKLAAAGEEFSHLIKLMNPDYTMRMRIFVQGLPDAIREKTIYGRAHSKMPARPIKPAKKKG
jgi:hypothetical protein